MTSMSLKILNPKETLIEKSNMAIFQMRVTVFFTDLATEIKNIIPIMRIWAGTKEYIKNL